MVPRAVPPGPGRVSSAEVTLSPFGRAISEFRAELEQKPPKDQDNRFLQALDGTAGSSGASTGGSQTEIAAKELHDSIADLEARKRSGKRYRLLHRLSPFLETFKAFMKKCESLSQGAPFGVSLAFAGARIVLEMALAVEEYLEVVVNAMERISGILEIYQKMQASPELEVRLIQSYKSIIKFWYKLSEILAPSKFGRVTIRSFLMPLKRETEDALKEMQENMHINLGISQVEGLRMADADRQSRADDGQKALKNEIRRWIMGHDAVDFKGDYEDQLDLRHKDTCSWIFDDGRFVDWRESRDNAVLWYNALPGSGKSVLASAVIEHLAASNKRVAYFYYSFSRSSSRSFVSGLRTLALQLLAFNTTPSDALVSMYETETQFGPNLINQRTLANVVHELITRIDDLYIVLDGLDECENETSMLGLLEGLVQRPTLGTTKWLFTSRVENIGKTMRRLKAVEVQPDPAAISGDIEKYLSSGIDCEGCIRAFTQECDNNFLIARFVRETLDKLTSEADIREELRSFPKKLNGYYARTLARLDTRGHKEQ